ncbi:hypothetical protein AALC16_04655 [Lachnospiraceae bacterium 29-91]
MEFKLISITVLIAFYGCYFVKMLRQKKQGIQTDQIGKGKVGFVKFVEVTMKVAAVLVFVAGFVSILCILTSFAVIMYHLQIVNVEEDFLLATFGNEYLQYRKKVCRYIGRKR